MAEVINLADRRKKAPPSIKELVDVAASSIEQNWESFAKVNRLNDFFVDATSVYSDSSVNYLSDLNAISRMETKLGMSVIIRSPFHGGHMGWKASFPLKSGASSTPDMPFETYARCFNILMFIKLKRDLLANGYQDEL